jgi:hypothetical protein
VTSLKSTGVRVQYFYTHSGASAITLRELLYTSTRTPLHPPWSSRRELYDWDGRICQPYLQT